MNHALFGIQGRKSAVFVEVAADVGARMKGWLGRAQAPAGGGLWIVPCDAVHTFAMRFPVDLLFIDAGGRIVRIDEAVQPWRVSVCFGAYSVVELAAGEARRAGLLIGDQFDALRFCR